MIGIRLEQATLDYPIFNANGRSLTSRLLEVATGGLLDRDPKGRVQVHALKDISFELSEGDKLGIIGHNGSGKSTLLRLLSQVYAPSSGRVSVSGNVGSLIDLNLGINPEASGRENVFIRGALLGLSKAKILEKYEEIVEFSQLGDFIEMPVRTYSTGMHMRLAFSVSTIMRPEILLMDEWLSVGDENFREAAEKRLQSLLDGAKILVIASHSKDLLNSVCNKILWLEHGHVKDFGEPSRVLEKYFV